MSPKIHSTCIANEKLVAGQHVALTATCCPGLNASLDLGLFLSRVQIAWPNMLLQHVMIETKINNNKRDGLIWQ